MYFDDREIKLVQPDLGGREMGGGGGGKRGMGREKENMD